MARTIDTVKEAQWLRFMDRQRASGQSISTFCASVGVTEPNFYRWRRLLGQRGLWPQDQATRPAAFVPVEVVGLAPQPSVLEIVVGGAAIVRVRPGFDAATLQSVLAVLEERPC